MPPPDFHLDHALSDWLGYTLELSCPCSPRVTFMPVRLLAQRGNRPFRVYQRERGIHGERAFSTSCHADQRRTPPLLHRQFWKVMTPVTLDAPVAPHKRPER